MIRGSSTFKNRVIARDLVTSTPPGENRACRGPRVIAVIRRANPFIRRCKYTCLYKSRKTLMAETFVIGNGLETSLA